MKNSITVADLIAVLRDGESADRMAAAGVLAAFGPAALPATSSAWRICIIYVCARGRGTLTPRSTSAPLLSWVVVD